MLSPNTACLSSRVCMGKRGGFTAVSILSLYKMVGAYLLSGPSFPEVASASIYTSITL